MSTPRKIITEHTFIGDWHTTTAPNGSASSEERRHHHVVIFEADYYGKGKPHRYAGGRTHLEFKHGGTAAVPDNWQDGDPASVKRWEERIEFSKKLQAHRAAKEAK